MTNSKLEGRQADVLAPILLSRRYGNIPGFPVGKKWRCRCDMNDYGVHGGSLTAGIHGSGTEGAYSVVP